MKNVFVWRRSRLFLPGADPIWSEPESAPGPRTYGAAQKRGGSATLLFSEKNRILLLLIKFFLLTGIFLMVKKISRILDPDLIASGFATLLAIGSRFMTAKHVRIWFAPMMLTEALQNKLLLLVAVVREDVLVIQYKLAEIIKSIQ